ncbi:MAG: heavy metal translocating P-type ATPase metal-binding domain-containing protein [Pseudomonadota bacterium]
MTEAETRSCDLCGLPAPPKDYALRTSTRTLAFCCEGCREIWRMLNAEEAETAEREKEGA